MERLREALLPQPKELTFAGDGPALGSHTPVRAPGHPPPLPATASRLRDLLARLSAATGGGPAASSTGVGIELLVDASALPRSQAYRLTIAASGIRLVGADPAAVAHGAATLGQCLAIAGSLQPPGGPRLPGLEIVDWPDFDSRGVLLDVSRDRVPTLSTLRRLVERLADWKFNQLQLYTEHTFAYRGHEPVWRHASPLTADEIRTLDGLCRDRAIELVPNQNSLGHFHRWLVHEPYRRLAECPQGIRHPFSEELEPFSLCAVDPEVPALLGDLYDQLLPCFSSRMFNVGLDETLDLGLGRSAAACADRGRGHVYLDFLRRVYSLVRDRGHRMQFWTDMILQSPGLVGELPADVLGLVWGYEADHPFRRQTRILAAAGLDHYVCPGTSSWNSLAGRLPNALGNLAAAAAAGRESRAGGYLVADWGDFGHLQPLSVSYPPLLAAAELGWNCESEIAAIEPRLADLVDRHALGAPGCGLGELAVRLGGAYQETGVEPRNSSLLFQLLLRVPESLAQPRFEALTRAGLERAAAALDDAAGRLPAQAATTAEAALAGRELEWVGRTLRFACRLGLARLELGRERLLPDLPGPVRRRLAGELEPLIDQFRALWRARSRPGGLAESVRRLERIRRLLG